jgi:hypothetical protein
MCFATRKLALAATDEAKAVASRAASAILVGVERPRTWRLNSGERARVSGQVGRSALFWKGQRGRWVLRRAAGGTAAAGAGRDKRIASSPTERARGFILYDARAANLHHRFIVIYYCLCRGLFGWNCSLLDRDLDVRSRGTLTCCALSRFLLSFFFANLDFCFFCLSRFAR